LRSRNTFRIDHEEAIMNARWTLLIGASLLVSAPLPGDALTASGTVSADVELILAVDASASMDVDELNVQRMGYIRAIQSDEVLRAIRTGFHRRIAVTYVEWGEPGTERVVVPWTVLATQSDAAAFAGGIVPRHQKEAGRTSMSRGLLFALGRFKDSPVQSYRQVIDISGDGPNNAGPPVDATRDVVVGKGVVINGLAITTKGGEGFGWQPWRPRDPEILTKYYKHCVIGGPGSFVVSVDHIGQFEAAIRQKLVLEISGLPVRLMQASARRAEDAVDCQVGEKNLGPFDPGRPKPFE
jgi:hypothetical protein